MEDPGHKRQVAEAIAHGEKEGSATFHADFTSMCRYGYLPIATQLPTGAGVGESPIPRHL